MVVRWQQVIFWHAEDMHGVVLTVRQLRGRSLPHLKHSENCRSGDVHMWLITSLVRPGSSMTPRHVFVTVSERWLPLRKGKCFECQNIAKIPRGISTRKNLLYSLPCWPRVVYGGYLSANTNAMGWYVTYTTISVAPTHEKESSLAVPCVLRPGLALRPLSD